MASKEIREGKVKKGGVNVGIGGPRPSGEIEGQRPVIVCPKCGEVLQPSNRPKG